MNRNLYVEKIKSLLSTLVYQVKLDNKANLNNDSIHVENTFKYIFNILFDGNFYNKNIEEQNSEAIDLIDDNLKIIIQVTSQREKKKISDTLLKQKLNDYNDYNLKFMIICSPEFNCNHLRRNTYNCPFNIHFNPLQDILDIEQIYKLILNLEFEKIKSLHALIKSEISPEIDMIKLDSNLVSIINILSKDDIVKVSSNLNQFEIKRKIEYNHLSNIAERISEMTDYYKKINEKYTMLDREGSNKSLSVLMFINKKYHTLKRNKISDLELYDSIVLELIEYVKLNQNYQKTTEEELLLAVEIIVADAFIKCKIFKNPEEYNYVNS